MMRVSQTIVVAIIVGLASAGFAFWKQASANDTDMSGKLRSTQADAIFAGGCFWCVEADFEKLNGVHEAISGYTGGHVQNPTYKQVSYEDTGHYEAVRVIYDPSVISYRELVEYFWRHVDPTDPNGQFCDKGDSYRTAIFVENEEERKIAESSKATIEASGVLDKPIVTEIIDQSTFWTAEAYHQNYYKTHTLRYKYYRSNCGRDRTIRKVWERENAKTH